MRESLHRDPDTCVVTLQRITYHVANGQMLDFTLVR
jgi:hypothetical protein